MVEAGKGCMPGRRVRVRWKRQGRGRGDGVLWERKMNGPLVAAEWEIIPN